MDHHIIGIVGGDIREDKVGDDGDKDIQEEEEGTGDHCMLSIGLIDEYPHE